MSDIYVHEGGIKELPDYKDVCHGNEKPTDKKVIFSKPKLEPKPEPKSKRPKSFDIGPGSGKELLDRGDH